MREFNCNDFIYDQNRYLRTHKEEKRFRIENEYVILVLYLFSNIIRKNDRRLSTSSLES